MTELLGYVLSGVLSEDAETILYRAIRGSDGLPVVVKMLRPGRFSPHEAGRLRNEFEIGLRIESPHVLKTLALESSEAGPALVLEPLEGEPLDHLLTGPMEVGLFLRIACKVAAALADVHAQGVVHKDIKPHNLIVDMGTLDVKLTDFGIAVSRSLEGKAARSEHPIEGTLAYISPEQTGRGNRIVDHRTDFYSLGVTFYLMLAGELPFTAQDPLEWFHAHIAGESIPLHERVPGVPHLLSALVAKLLAKSPEDRYQSAEGLKNDLQRALEEWEANARIPLFTLGEQDLLEKFRVPNRLYGRESEKQTLLNLFEQGLGETPSLVLISGYSGTGKSSLVNELQKPIAARRGFFASGKFDPYKRSIPLATIDQVVSDLSRQLLVESENALAAWKQELSEAVGSNGRLLTDAFPLLELILGPQPPLPELLPTESRHRFNRVFLSFLSVFAKPTHPLVLFFDDLQWADTASLNLIELILTGASFGSLMLIGAYRDNEINAAEPPLRHLKSHVPLSEIALGPLQESVVAQLVADTLKMPAPELARHIFDRTQGNPFFITQFIKMLYDERLLRFDARNFRWDWDFREIQRRACAENVVDLMLLKLNKLSDATREALRVAASVGNCVQRQSLAMIMGRSEDELVASLQEAVHEGLLLTERESYRFLHDRVRQAAYRLVAPEERASLHLHIARAWSRSLSPVELDERIFELVEQFNQGVELITDLEESRNVARLNLNAGRKAMQSTAYRAAGVYFATGADLLQRRLGEHAWLNDYDLAYALHLARARCEWFNGNSSEAELLLQNLFSRTRNVAEQIEVFEMRVNIHTTRGEITRSVELAIEGLALVGIELQLHPSEDFVRAKLQALTDSLQGRPIENLLELPAMVDADMKAAMGLLSSVVSSAFFTDPWLWCWMLCHMVELSLRFGYTEGSAVGYVFFGLVLGSLLGQYELGYRFGRLACEIVDRDNLVASKVFVYNVFGDSINFWLRHMRIDLDYLHRSFAAALESGNLQWACYACNHIVTCRLTMGDSLVEVWRESELRLEFVRRARFDDVVDIIIGIQRFVQNMRGLTQGFSSFDGDGFSETEFEAHLADSRMTTMVCWYWILKLQARFLSGDFKVAFDAAEKARPLIWSSLGHLQFTDYHFYRALTLAVLYDQESAERREQILQELKEQRDRFAEWAKNGPENFENRFALLSAELARIEGRVKEAMRFYDDAIASAARNGFVQNEAMACEMAARFYRLQKFDRIEHAYLRDARSRYAAWGADGKVRQLDALFPGLSEIDTHDLSKTFTVSSAQFDLTAVLKASQTISGEILMPRLTDTLLRVIAQAAGAQRGWLLLWRNGSFVPAAAVGEGSNEARIPSSIINYVRRTRAPLLLDDLTSSSLFSIDPVFQNTLLPKSVLCLPISRGGEPEALLYLEHDSIPAAFASERLALLELLAGQAAISLENARLYQQSLEAVRMREDFLSVASHELRTPLTPLKLQIQTLAALSRGGDLRSFPQDKLDRLLENADRQITQLAKLLDNLLDVSRINGGRLEMAFAAVNFSALVRQAVNQHRSVFESVQSSVSLEVEADIWVRADAERLEQVVFSVLSNAARYGAGYPVDIRLSKSGKLALLGVQDFGVGISPENQERIFRPFDRAQQSTRNFGGFGLGLYLTREILKVLGGSIRVESHPGKGACFLVELPLLQESHLSKTGAELRGTPR